EKQHAAHDVLGLFREVLAHERIVEAEPVGEDDRLTVFLERFGGIALLRVDRHREVAEAHGSSPQSELRMMILKTHLRMIDGGKKLFVRYFRARRGRCGDFERRVRGSRPGSLPGGRRGVSTGKSIIARSLAGTC